MTETLAEATPGLTRGDDGLLRCAWGTSAPDYVAYHDEEWGRPVHGETALYERFTLEAFQSGLSWLTILRKREGFRAAFAGFDAEQVARFSEADVERLLLDASIVRNRKKIEVAISNARAVLELRESVEGGLDGLVWSFAPPAKPAPRPGEVPATTPESKALAKALKAHGFRFVGPTTAYAAMQACGLVDDHVMGCHVRS
ncbi:DNA-3-methyladenine glycosylase I [Spongisporangium articulatum]|uniref:DNA-3-methyladenine glycosylase I n=1 Tax=Spongisporangium articulatum TaxID=3362603 RepID=A0ABW8AQ62_9ACTN